MNTKMKTIMLMFAVSATAFVAAAQDDGTNAPPPGGPDQDGPGFGPGQHHHPPIPAIVRALDVNHDGIIDSNEIANASAELLTLDKNGDGQLTCDEYMGKRPGRQGPPPDANGDDAGGPPDGGPGGPPDDATNTPPPGGPDQGGPGPGGHHMPVPAIVRALDVNHDGIIDSNEIANASAELLTLDKNGDGRLTRDEYMGKRPGRQGPPPEDGNDGDGGDMGGPPDGPPRMDQ